MTQNTTHTIIAEPGAQTILQTRIFDAPRDLVYKTCTNPDLIPQWWGPKSSRTTVDKMEVRKGGIWRFIHHELDGTENAFNGVYHECLSPERLTYTFEWEGLPGHILLETIRFAEHEGKTKITVTSVFQTVEDRDGMLNSGMEEGATETWNRFAELLTQI
jgi:uncharacterized protein YndB with AHSA1/START domain